jgi:single-stranded-DNA-specific exonuclease
MQKTWKIRKPHPELQLKFSREFGIHPVISQLLVNRGILTSKEAQSFLNPDLALLHDPMKMKDLEKAVTRIKKARHNKEKVLIFSDYDCDGITACVLLKSVLHRLGISVSHYIPHRANEGYGLNENIAAIVKEKKADLLISVDCGVTAVDEIASLNKAGCDTIVVDHHQPKKGKLPAAVAVIDPKREDCGYPFKELASVGLVYKLSQALTGENLLSELDLVAMGTISDVMSLSGENRVLVKEGLKQISKSERPGIRALLEICKLKDKDISVGMVGFILGPRINACGRMDSAEKAVELLSAKDMDEALRLAKELDKQNRDRQKIQDQVLSQALNLVEKEVNFKDHNVIVVSQEGWHSGVLGIVASRIAEKYYRPTIVISLENGIGKGSGRSIENFHLFDALTNCSEVLQEFGGHRHAAGLTILKGNVAQFRKVINDFARINILPEDLLPSLNIDCQVPLSVLNVELVRDLENLAPFGMGNPQPVLCSRNLELKGEPMLLGKETIKFWVSDGKLTAQVVGFGRADLFSVLSAANRMDLTYSPSIDDWQDEPAVQLELKDIKIVP